MEIKFHGTLTKQDFVEAIKLYFNSGKFLWLRILSIAFYSLLFIGLAYLTEEWIYILFGAVIALLFWFLPRLSAWVNWRKFEALKGPWTGLASDEWIKMHHPLAIIETRWELYKKLLVNEKVMILLPSAMTFRPIPRSYFSSDADWTAFVELVKSKVLAR